MTPEQYIDIAVAFDFELIFEKPDNKLLRFQRFPVKVDVWYSSGTIGLYYPGGKTQQFFRDKTLLQVLKMV